MSVEHRDLAVGPFRPSRVLSDFKAARERERHARRAEQETARAMADLRRATRAAPARREPRQPVAPVGAFDSRAFNAAGTDRVTAGWVTHNSGINADLEMALDPLRARSRGWAMNTDLGRRYVSMVQDNIVGATSPMLQVRAMLASGDMDEAANTAIEEAWWDWCRRGHCEVTGQLSFHEVCRAAAAAAARDGEFLARRVRSRSLHHGYALQLLDVDRIATTGTVTQGVEGRNKVRLGVETDPMGRKVALHLYSAHPGDSGAGVAPRSIADRVTIDNVLHGFVLERPEQVRGYPWTAAILQGADSLATYKRYALVAAKIGAAKMGFYVLDKDAPQGEGLDLEEYRDATGALVQDVEPGMLEALPPGVDFKSFDPDYPHQAFDSFVTGHERGLAAGLNVAHHNLTGNMTGVNYSSARIAELAERSHWRALQRWFIEGFVRPVFADWLQMALLGGHIRLPSGATLPAERADKFIAAASFQPRTWDWVDPQADGEAAVLKLANDMRSLRQINDEQGVDLEEVLADKARLLKRYQDLGLPAPAWLQPPQPATGGAAA